MPIDRVLEIAGLAIEALVIAMLAWRRIDRILPVFCAYIAWGLLSDCAMQVMQRSFPSSYVRGYLVEMSLDSLLQYFVLVELASAVLRSFHALPPRRVLIASVLGVLLAGAVAWPFTLQESLARLRWDYVLIVRLSQTFSILRVAFFLVLAAASHWLTLGWRNRELQVATGLGVYSLVSLLGSLAHKHQVPGSPAYHWVEFAIAASYVASLLYWLASFAQKEPPPRAMPEHAKDVLTGMAVMAREGRAAMESRRDR
jgi:hypothetical protein